MATEKLWTGFDNTKIMAERAVCDEVGQNIVDTYATKSGVPSVYNAKLKLQLGSSAAADTGFTANADADATIEIPVMTGATAQEAGDEGLVPAPTTSDTDKFLKGDGTWDSPAAADLTYYYYDAEHNGLSAINSKSSRASLVGTNGNLNNASIQATFKLDWGGVVKELLTVDTLNENKSYLRFGGNARATEGQRYLLPRPTANKFAQTNSDGAIVWGDAPESVPTPSVDNSLLLGQSDGSNTWTVLERDTFSAITDDNGEDIQDEEGTSIGDENSVELWTSFNGIGFGAERAVADIDGNSLNLTISDDQVIAIGGKSIGGGTVVDAYTKAETDGLLADKADKSELPILRQAEASEDTTINVVNNRVTWVSNITYSTMTFNVVVPSGESANFAIELLSQHACTVSVTVNGVQVPKASAAINELEVGKTYQLTCVGYGWTCAEIDVPNYTVTVGNKTYGATRLGNHLWTTENLDYLFTGCTLNGTPENKPMAWNNSADPTYEDTYGIVYNYKAAVYLAEHADELLPSGWRLPTLDDWRQLGATIGWDPTQSGQMVTGDKANAFRNTDWYMWNSATQQADLQGTNLYGLNVLPAGTCVNGEFDNIGSEKNDVGFWASDSLDLSSYRLWFASVGITYGWSYVSTSNTYNYGVHIRLIKDL